VTAQLPTSFSRAARKLRALLARERPAIVLCTGLAADRAAISIECVAVNLCAARIADNDGDQPAGRAVIGRAPAAYRPRLPVRAMVRALKRAGIAAELSMSAGTFVCNHVYFSLMHEVSAGRSRRFVRRAGFVHVPALSADNGRGSLEEYARALRIILQRARHDLAR
jgi:pyroglutamyl-peptidase